MDLWKKVFRSELSFSWERTCRRPYGLITKSLKLKYFSRSSLAKVVSNTAAQKIIEDAICGGGENLKDNWPFARRVAKMTLYHRIS